MDALKKWALFALGFFGMLGAISLGYSAYVTAFPATASSGSVVSFSEWNKMVQALQDLDVGIQKSACEGRRGVWTAGACQEYAYYTAACTYTTCSCNAGYHKCTFPDLFTGGFASLRRPGYDPGTYVWVAGNYPSAQDSFFYPSWWAGGSALTCSANSHYMMDVRRNASGNTAWGCYPDSYAYPAACCRDNQ